MLVVAYAIMIALTVLRSIVVLVGLFVMIYRGDGQSFGSWVVSLVVLFVTAFIMLAIGTAV